VTQLIHVAATLGVADFLRDGPKSSDELAASLRVDPEALYRVLRALASLGVFAETNPHQFALTELAQPLQSDVPGSLRASAILYGERWWWQACGELLHSVRTGLPAFAHVHGEALFAYLDHAADAAAIFNDHQTNMTRQDAAAIVSAYDFRECARVVDVGSGHGALTAAILKACPRTTVVLFDQPAVIEGAKQRLRAEGVIDRCSFSAGDFFESVPEGGDAYVLKDIIHDWDDVRAMTILRNCRRVMTHAPAVTARVLVVEKVIPPGNASFPGKLTDITMLLVAGGRERTAKEYETLLTGAGLTLTRIVPTASPASVIEATPGR
jgi:ubiquinone/menaquinone biosynthesis C-methylase UbiE